MLPYINIEKKLAEIGIKIVAFPDLDKTVKADSVCYNNISSNIKSVASSTFFFIEDFDVLPDSLLPFSSTEPFGSAREQIDAINSIEVFQTTFDKTQTTYDEERQT